LVVFYGLQPGNGVGLFSKEKVSKEVDKLKEQEGQHPLTGQRAANFRLLANQ